MDILAFIVDKLWHKWQNIN